MDVRLRIINKGAYKGWLLAYDDMNHSIVYSLRTGIGASVNWKYKPEDYNIIELGERSSTVEVERDYTEFEKKAIAMGKVFLAEVKLGEAAAKAREAADAAAEAFERNKGAARLAIAELLVVNGDFTVAEAAEITSRIPPVKGADEEEGEAPEA
jgi:hypothetical protein